MKIKNYRWLWLFIIFISLYLLTRLINLGIIPIFTDEAIYVYWAQVALHDPNHRFISLEDGKQPLFIWMAAVAQKFFEDPLIASRLVSVMAGLASILGIYLLAKTLFSERVAMISSLLYLVLPFTLLYDRMALFDSLLTTFGIYAVLITFKQAKNPMLDLALLNGFAIGLGMITKSSANFFLYLLPFSLILFDWQKENKRQRLLKWFVLTGLSATIALILFNLLRLSPLFYLIERKNHEFIRTFSEVFKDPLAHFPGNLDALLGWLISYNGVLLVTVAILTIIWGYLKRQLKLIYLSFFVIAPFSAMIFFNKVLYPRFELFYFPYMIILIAYAFVSVAEWQKKHARYIWLAFLIAIFMPIINSFLLLTNPPRAKIPASDKEQYLNSWPAGYGVKEVIQVLKEEPAKNILVGTEGTFGLLPFALKIYFYSNPNIVINGYWPVSDIPLQILDSSKNQKTFFIFNESQNIDKIPHKGNLKLVGQYQKGSGNSFMRFYEVTPP